MRAAAIIALAVLLALPAAGHSYRVGGILVGHVWAVPTPGADTEVYAGLLNKAAAPDQLVAVLAPTAQVAEIVDAASRRIDAVDLPANRPVALKPGGIRIRLAGLDRPLRVGDKLKLTLIFAKAGPVAVEALVEAGSSHG